MANILIVIYLLIVIAMIVIILLQRSEGGALGMGGNNSGGMAPIRTSANLLTRTTGILAALFMSTAIGLSIVNDIDRSTNSILDNATQGQSGEQAPATNVLDALNSLQGEGDSLAVPPVEPTAPIDPDAPNLALPTPSTSDTPTAPASN